MCKDDRAEVVWSAETGIGPLKCAKRQRDAYEGAVLSYCIREQHVRGCRGDLLAFIDRDGRASKVGDVIMRENDGRV